MDKIKLDITCHGEVASQSWEEGWDIIHSLAAAVREGVIDPDSRVEGELRVSVASRSEVSAVNEKFGDVVRVDDTLQQFDDLEVAKVITEKHGGEKLVTPSHMKSIKDIGYWFANNTNIKSFNEFENTSMTVMSSCQDAKYFVGCSNLTELKLPDTMTTLGNTTAGRDGTDRSPLRGTSIKFLDLNNVTFLGLNSLYGTSINIDLKNSKVTRMREGVVFGNNTGIEHLDFTNIQVWNSSRELDYYCIEQNITNLKTITFGNRYSKINNDSLRGCKTFERFVNTKNITTIVGVTSHTVFCNICRGSAPYVFNFPSLLHIGQGNLDQGILNAANGSNKLKFVGLNSVIAVGTYSMAHQSHIKCIDFGANLETVISSFVNNSKFILIVRAINSPSLDGSLSARVSKLFVPSGSIELYKQASNWNSLSSVTFAIGGTEWVSAMNELALSEGKTLDNPADIWSDYYVFDEESPE